MASPSGSSLNFTCNSPDQPKPWFGGNQNTPPLTGLLVQFPPNFVQYAVRWCGSFNQNIFLGKPACPSGLAAFPNGTVSTITADLESQRQDFNGIWHTNQFFGGNTLNVILQDPSQQLTMWKSAPTTFTFNNIDNYGGAQQIKTGGFYQETTGFGFPAGTFGNFSVIWGLKQINCTIFAVLCGLPSRNQPINFYLYFDQYMTYNGTVLNFSWWHPNDGGVAADFLFCGQFGNGVPTAFYPEPIYNIGLTCDRIKLENIIVLP